LVDESSLWPGGRFVTTQLVVTTRFLAAHRAVVQKLVDAQVRANALIRDHVAEAEQLVSKGIERVTGKPIDASLVVAGFRNVHFTNDPISSSLVVDNRVQGQFGFPHATSLQGIYDLSFLNRSLTAAGEAAVTAPLRLPKAPT